MKKKLLTILCSIFMLVLLAFTASANNLGDVTGDGKINAADARLTLRYASKLDELTEEQIAAADVDASGKVTAADARKILRVASHLDVPFEGLNIDEYLVEEGVLNVAVPIDNAPFGYIEDGVVKGFDVETVTKLASKTRLEVKLHPMSFEECVEAVKNGTCDIATGIDERKLPDGMISVGKYFTCVLNCVVLKDSTINSVAEIRNNNKLNFGVLENTPGSDVVETIFGRNADAYFETCADAVVALENGSIDVFITDDTYAIHTANSNGTVKDVRDELFYMVENMIVTSASKTQLAEKLKTYVTNLNSDVDWDESGRSSISVSQKEVTLRPGGTACIEITADCFYTPNPSVSMSGSFCKTSVEVINGKTYAFITAPSDIVVIDSVSAVMWSGSQSYSASITVEIDVDCPDYYQYFDGIKIPDFGAFTSTAPYETVVDKENGVIVHTYSAEDLYNNGVTDGTKLDAYLQSVQNAGFRYYGYQELENTVTYIFGNETSGRAVSYVELYDEEGYIIAVGVGYNFPANMN